MTTADILRCTGHPIQRITLRVHGHYSFSAGQYLMVKGDNGTDIPMSIASAPARLPELELHYRSTPDSAEAMTMDRLLTGSELTLADAAGEATCGSAAEPLFIVAGGSGAAQAFSCAEQRAIQQSAPTTILWCADNVDDIYEVERLQSYTGVRLQVCIDDRRTADNEGLKWLQQHSAEFRKSRVILAGSPGFVYAATDVLIAAGFAQSELLSDVYAYAPRPD